MAAKIHKLPGADIFPTFNNVQATLQICRNTGLGVLHFDCVEGSGTLEIGWELGEQLLALMRPMKEYA